MIDLNLMREDIKNLATSFFYLITGLPEDVRPDDKKRTGVRILIKQPKTRNLMIIRIADPSEAAMYFCVEKAVRSETLGHCSSQNSEDEKEFKFAGSLTVIIDGEEVQVSTSGMRSEEDVAMDVMILAHIFTKAQHDICENVRANGGLLPECFSDEKHFLHRYMNAKEFFYGI